MTDMPNPSSAPGLSEEEKKGFAAGVLKSLVECHPMIATINKLPGDKSVYVEEAVVYFSQEESGDQSETDFLAGSAAVGLLEVANAILESEDANLDEVKDLLSRAARIAGSVKEFLHLARAEAGEDNRGLDLEFFFPKRLEASTEALGILAQLVTHCNEGGRIESQGKLLDQLAEDWLAIRNATGVTDKD